MQETFKNIEEVKEIEQIQKKEQINQKSEIPKKQTREELRARLKLKIDNKKTTRTNGINRKKSQNINDSFKKITELLVQKNIENSDQIDNNLIETIMTIISKEDLQLIILKMQENSKFKELLQNISNKMDNT